MSQGLPPSGSGAGSRPPSAQGGGGLVPGRPMANVPMGPMMPGHMPVGVAVAVDGQGGAVTARQAGGLIDLRLQVSPLRIPLPVALQNVAKAVNIAFQTNFAENMLETVYQAAIVRKREILVVHKDYFGYGTGWFSMFGRLLKSLELTTKGPDPVSPEFQRLIEQNIHRTISGLLNLMFRKLDIVPEYEDRVPFYFQQMFDRLEASGIIVGWSRDEWTIRTTKVGLDIRVEPAEWVWNELEARELEAKAAQAERVAEAKSRLKAAREAQARAKVLEESEPEPNPSEIENESAPAPKTDHAASEQPGQQ